MVFKFRMLSDENDHFVRDYEVMYDTTLAEFNDFILESLGYEECMTSFFTADSRWEKGREFTLMDMGSGESGEAPLPMSDVVLGQVVHKNRDRLIWLFDMFSDRAYYLELVATREAGDDEDLPCMTLAEAEAPDQFDPSASAETNSIFDEAMSEFGDFEGDDDYDDEYF